MVRRRKPRRGVLLLIVLSILVLFALIGTTFLVATSQYRNVSRVAARVERHGDDPERLLDQALMEVLRGPRVQSPSALDGHAILEDLYGRDSLRAAVRAVKDIPRQDGSGQPLGQWLVLELTPTGPLPDNHYYNGAVLTMTSGALKGLSTRVIEYFATADVANGSQRTGVGGLVPNPTFPLVVVEAFGSERQMATARPTAGDRLLINGLPFNGTGAGFDPRTKNLDLVDPETTLGQMPAALLPALHGKMAAQLGLNGTAVPTYAGGLDESWDAPDYQNLYLAMIDPSVQPGQPANSFLGKIIPSFHRPWLVNYWKTNQPTLWQSPDFRRRVILRPMVDDHPGFTGSNPQFDPIKGPFDVDNDGDGVPESIWIDAAFPIRTTPDGRTYKPLMAVLCVDLDGRVNLNTSGDWMDVVLGSDSLPDDPDTTFYGWPATTGIPAGQGFGPGEIELLGPQVGGVAQPLILQTPLQLKNLLDSKYRSTREVSVPIPGPGRLGVDPLAMRNFYGLVPSDPNNPSREGLYGTAHDLRGLAKPFVDRSGNPVWWKPANIPAPGEYAEPPYEMNLVELDGTDTPFSEPDMETLLRAWDGDAAALSPRMAAWFGTTMPEVAANPLRKLVTHRSFSIPVPVDPGTTLAGRLRAYLEAAGMTDPGVIEDQVAIMLPHEVRHGRPMDLNRLWGNGLDDNGDGLLIDEWMEKLQGEPLLAWGSNVQASYALDDPLIRAHAARVASLPDMDPSRQLLAYAPRQMYARHLYCMAMLLMDQGFTLPMINPALDGTLNDQQKRALLARRVAQWAINAVDFRDHDAVMTPFEFDLNPLNGWSVDGDITTLETTNERSVVWGCEYPYLLLTETLATHDTRLFDSEWDDGEEKQRDQDGDGDSSTDKLDNQPEDDDLDQYRIPQGSAFFELYCTAPPYGRRHSTNPGDFDQGSVFDPNSRSFPPELFRFVGNGQNGMWKLDLERMSADTINPVWRLAISEPHEENASVQALALQAPDVARFQPESLNLIQPNLQLTIDRVVWFTRQQPPNPAANLANRVFYNRLRPDVPPAWLAPKQYALVGPRKKTYLGEVEGSQAHNRYIELTSTPGQVVVANEGGLTDYPPYVARPLPVIAVMDSAQGWNAAQVAAAAPEGFGINVSEPLPTTPQYYPPPSHDPRNPQPGEPKDAYGVEGKLDGNGGVSDPGIPFPDEPLDYQNPNFDDFGLPGEGTRPNFRTVFLQRLADPTRPFHPVFNPYLTIDWLPIDVTVFNGTDSEEEAQDGKSDWSDGTEWNDLVDAFGRADWILADRQRGLVPNAPNPVSIWKAISQLPGPDNSESAPAHYYFRINWQIYTLGYVNSTYGFPQPPAGGVPPEFVGDPIAIDGTPRPQPWLAWNNRPYATPLELVQVPASSPDRLTYEFLLPTVNTNSPYAVSDSTPHPVLGRLLSYYAPYGHLMNFFHSGLSTAQAHGSNFARLLDFVTVPSHYAGTRRWYNTQQFTGIPGFQPPFNYLPQWREPGKININTIYDPVIWQALSPPAIWDTSWGDLQEARQGFPLQAINNYPTRFANPFRAATSSEMMPLLRPPESGAGVPVDALRKPSAQATLLRSDPDDPDKPLFQYESNDGPLQSDRNAYFRYRTLQRLSNLVTTQSNVFAVWITVGYFEVYPNPGGADAAHPDGYQLGAELGIDTGEVKRHRAFYLIDRSIPVGFEPGENHNAWRTVLLRRILD